MASVDIGAILDSIENSDPLAIDLKKRTRDFLQKLNVPLPLAEAISNRVAFSVGLVLAAVGLLISIAINIADPLLRVFLRVLTKARIDTVPEQIDISAAVLSEFLAAEIDPSHLKTGKTGDQTINAARAIGGALFARLTQEFVPDGKVSPDSGEKAAQTFSGYAINFAVQNTMIGTLADALSFHFLEDFRELGVEVARNIGLGRLVRLALQPLIRNAIQQPYDLQLRKRYRPDRLTDSQYVKAFARGAMDQATLNDRLAEKGVTDDDIPLLINELSSHLTDAEVSTLLRFGEIDADTGLAEVMRAGFSADLAKKRLRVNELTRVDSLITAYKSLIGNQRIDGLIDQDAYEKLLDRLPITDEEKQLERNFVGTSVEVPRSFLTWAEVETAFIAGAVDLDYVDRWLIREGFSDEDQLLKELLLLQKLDKTITKEQAAAAVKSAKASH